MPSHLIAIPFGFLLRVVQILVDSSLYLVIGLLSAGALRAMVSPARLRGLFGTGRWSAPLRAWAAATTLLPVCSLGVLPILRELRRAGVTRPAILTFALAAPMLNPISLVYGVSYLGPSVLAVLILGTGLVSVGVGVAWGYLRPQDLISDGGEPEGRVPSVGLGRIAAAAVHASRESVGPTARDVAWGVVGAGLLASLIAAPSLASSMFEGDAWAVPRMMAVAPASYITPDQTVALIPEMLKFRQSAGALFVLVALGAGMTIGHLRWIAGAYGGRSAALWMALAGGLALAAALAAGRLVPPVGTANEDNDHFATLANPLENADDLSGVRDGVARYVEGLGPFRLLTCGALLGLVVAGLVLRSLGTKGTFEHFISADVPSCEMDSAGPGSPWSRPVPPRLLRAVAPVVLLMIGVAVAYAYFPSPAEAFQDMQIIKADFYGELAAPATAAPLHHLDLWDRQAAKLPAGAVLRLSLPSPEARRATADLRDGIRSLRSAVEALRPDEARALFAGVQEAFARCRKAYDADVAAR